MNYKLCGKCRHLISNLGICSNPELVKTKTKPLKRYGEDFIRLDNCKNPVAQPKSKYQNEKITVNEITYDSKLEADRHFQLKILERKGEIKNLKYHKRIELIPKSQYGQAIYYEADFVYETKKGKKVIEDCKCKATKTALYRLKKRLIAERYGIKITEVFKEGDR